MNYTDIMVIVLSFLSIFICLFVIWLVIIFYRLYAQFALVVTEMSKGLDITTVRLERLPKILYDEELTFPENSFSGQVVRGQGRIKNIKESDQINKTKKEENEKNNQGKAEKELSKKMVLENEEI